MRYRRGSDGSPQAVLCIELEFGDTAAVDELCLTRKCVFYLSACEMKSWSVSCLGDFINTDTSCRLLEIGEVIGLASTKTASRRSERAVSCFHDEDPAIMDETAVRTFRARLHIQREASEERGVHIPERPKGKTRPGD